MSKLLRCQATTLAGRRCLHKAFKEDTDTYLCRVHMVREDRVCSICLDVISNPNNEHVTECNHVFHVGCFLKWTNIRNTCPCCRQPVDKYMLIRMKVIRFNARKYHKSVESVFWLKTKKFMNVDECFEVLMKDYDPDACENKISLCRTVMEIEIKNGDNDTGSLSFKYLPQSVLRHMHEETMDTKLRILKIFLRDVA